VARKVPRGKRERWYSSITFPPFVSSLPSCPPSLHVNHPFMSIDEAEPVLLYLLGDLLSFVGAVHSASPPHPSLCVLPPFVSSLPPFVSFLPSCPSSLRVLPPFVSFFPLCPSSLHVQRRDRACSSLLTRRFSLLCWGST
jgi:hypothetical protein